MSKHFPSGANEVLIIFNQSLIIIYRNLFSKNEFRSQLFPFPFPRMIAAVGLCMLYLGSDQFNFST